MTRPLSWFRVLEASQVRVAVHAKRFGTTFTLCGLDATNLRKDWDKPFRPTETGACTECVRMFLALHEVDTRKPDNGV